MVRDFQERSHNGLNLGTPYFLITWPFLTDLILVDNQLLWIKMVMV